MGTTVEKLQKALDNKTSIKQAITNKRGGINIGENQSTWASEIDAIEPLLDTLDITENGEHNVKDYKNVSVLVQSEGDLKIKQLIETSANNFEIPYGVSRIDNYSFYNRGIGVTFKGKELINSIGKYAFYNESVIYSPISLDLPNCTVIDTYAFYNRSFNNFNLPNCTSIGNYAFYLKNTPISATEYDIYLPKMTEIGQYVFYNIANKNIHSMKINLPNCTSIGKYAFSKNRITEINIPNITTIGDYAFEGDKSTGSGVQKEIFYMFDNVTKIGSGAFGRTNSIKEVYLNSKCEEIGYGPFAECQNLEKFILNEGLKKIGNCMLLGTKVTTQIIPSTVTEIGTQLYPASRIIFTFLSETPCTISNITFSKTYVEKIFVPRGTSGVYKSATNWSAFADIIFERNSVIVNVPSALLNNESYIYSIDNGATYQQFTNNVLSLNDVSVIKIKSTTTDNTIIIGTTQGGNDVGTIANSELTFSFTTDTNVYLTIQ